MLSEGQCAVGPVVAARSDGEEDLCTLLGLPLAEAASIGDMTLCKCASRATLDANPCCAGDRYHDDAKTAARGVLTARTQSDRRTPEAAQA